MASGEMNDADWQAFLDQVLALLSKPLIEGGVIFAFMDWRSIHRLYAAGFSAGLDLVNLIVWYKEAGAMGGLYRSAHELVSVFCKGKVARTNNIELGRHGRNRTNVWVAPGADVPPLIRTVFGWNFPLMISRWEKENSNEGIEVLGGADRVCAEAG